MLEGKGRKYDQCRFFYYADKNMVILKAENPAYEDMILTNDELNNFHVLGKAVAFQSDVK